MPSETASNRHREPRHGPPCSHPGETTQQHHRTGRKASVIRLRHAPGPGGELKTAEIHCAARPNNGHLIALGCPHSFIPWARELVSKLGTLTRTHITPKDHNHAPQLPLSPPRTARRGIPFTVPMPLSESIGSPCWKTAVQWHQWMAGDEQLSPRDTGQRDRDRGTGQTACRLSPALRETPMLLAGALTFHFPQVLCCAVSLSQPLQVC